MKIRAHWVITDYLSMDHAESVWLTVDELLDVCSNLKNGDVIYTYHENYVELGARIALWGTENGKVEIDAQYTSGGCTKTVEFDELKSYLKFYKNLILTPEAYGMACDR